MGRLTEKALQLQERLEEVLKEEKATYQTATSAVIFVLHDLGACLSYDDFIQYKKSVISFMNSTLDDLEKELKDSHENRTTN